MTTISLRRLVLPVRPFVRSAAAPRRARARSAVLAGLLAVVVANLGLSLAVERHRPQWRDPEYFHRQKQLVDLARWNRESAEPRPLVVVLGSSRTQMGFAAALAAEASGAGAPVVYNLSQSGCQPLGQLLNFRRMIDAKVVPDLLLIEILPAALGEREPLEDLIPASRFGAADFARAAPYFDEPGAVRARWLGAKLAAWYSLRVDLLAHAKMADWTPAPARQEFLWNALRPDGWMPYYPAEWTAAKGEALLARSGRDFRTKFQDFAIVPKVAAAQRELLTECRRRGIPTALLVMPESPAFRALYPAAALDRLRRHCADLVAEYGVPLVDCRAWFDDEALFWDGNHLQGVGAERFSRRFGTDCLRSLLDDRAGR